MRERHVPRPLRVERPQHGQVRVDGVAALHADQGGHPAAAEGGLNVVGARAEGLQSGVETFLNTLQQKEGPSCMSLFAPIACPPIVLDYESWLEYCNNFASKNEWNKNSAFCILTA